MAAGGSVPAQAARQVKTMALSAAIRILRRSPQLRVQPTPKRLAPLRLEMFRKRSLPGIVLSSWRVVTSSSVAQLARDLQSGCLNQRSELPQPGNRHAYHRRSNTEAGIHAGGVVPDGSRDAAYVEFVLLQIASVDVLSHPVEFRVQLLKVAHCVRGQTLQRQ